MHGIFASTLIRSYICMRRPCSSRGLWFSKFWINLNRNIFGWHWKLQMLEPCFHFSGGKQLWEQPNRNVAMEGRWGHPSINQTPTHVEGTWLFVKSSRLPILAKQLQGRQRKRREWSRQCTSENNVVENEIYGSVQAPRDFPSEETEGPKLSRSRKHLLDRINWSSGFKISNVQVVLSLSAVVGFLHAQAPNGGGGPQQHLPWAAPGSTRTDRKASLKLESSWADGRREPWCPQIHKSMKQPFCAHRDLVQLCFLICIMWLNFKMSETSK